MFEPVEMQKIRLIGLRSDMPALISALQELGAMQFSKMGDKRLAAEKPLESYSIITEQLIRMRGIAEQLTPQKFEKPQKEIPLEKLLDDCRGVTIGRRLSWIKERLDSIKGEEADLAELARVLEGLKGMDLSLSLLKNRHLCFFIGRIGNDKLWRVESGIRQITDRHLLRSSRIGRGEAALLLAADGKFNAQISEMLQKAGFLETKLSHFVQSTDSPLKMLVGVKKRAELLKEERAALLAEREEISRANYANVLALCEMLEAEAARAQAPENFGRTVQTFVMTAWLPKTDFQRVAEVLRARFRNLHMERMEDGEEPPTLLGNPQALGPFQFMVEFISLPKSRELDPTLIFALTFPIIYGMMLGDAGYGLASMLLAYLVMRKFKGTMLEPVGKVWMFAAVPAILFGIVYNEFFGFTHEQLLGVTLYSGIPRMESISFLLVAFIFVGAAHLGLGFLLGAFNKFREGERPHAFAKLGWVAVEISGIALVATAMFNALPGIALVPAAAVFIIGLAAVVKGEGAMGLIELPSLAGNILSYARILAVGIASVVVAELLNELLLPRAEQGLMILVFAPLYLFLHLFNMVLGMFEALVQGARLNYVEFFSKFYEGGGKPFAPFMRIRRFTA